jgi:hypothetical protein
MRRASGGLALWEQDRKHNPALRVRNLDHPSGFLISHAPNGYHSVDQLERVPMGRLKAAHLPSDVVRIALIFAPEVKVEPLHAPGLPVGTDRPDDARRGSGWQSEPGGKPTRGHLGQTTNNSGSSVAATVRLLRLARKHSRPGRL